MVIGYASIRERLDMLGLGLSSLSRDPRIIVITFRLLVGGFVLFTGVLVAVGAIIPTAEERGAGKEIGIWTVAVVTFANGGDNIGVYVAVFFTVGPTAMVA
ncbi:Uncharacterised protein [Kocuria rosea]|nr:Uncharacterised protein [Kocuria rosea]